MFEHLIKIRYVVVIVVILAVLHALAFLAMGAQTAVHAYAEVVRTWREPGADARPGVQILHSLDYLFVAVIFIVLALGIAKLFLLKPGAAESMELPTWLRVHSVAELKVLLWETILVTLVITSLSQLTAGLFGALPWTALVTPIAILMLSLGLYFLKKAT
jgi:uncharacterized membrane protein YqhA